VTGVTAVELTDWGQNALAAGGRILLVVVLAIVVNRLGRKAILRVGERMRRATDDVLNRAPGVLVNSDRSTRSAARAATLSSVLRSSLSALLIVIVVLTVMTQLGISLGPLVAGAGIASIALGFGAQSLVRDMLAGIFVIFEDQYGVGDIIDAGPASGTVEHVSLRRTRLRDISGTVWHIPNGTITSVGNLSQNWARAVVDLVVSQETDLGQARAIIATVANELSVDPDYGPRMVEGSVDEQGVQASGPEGVTLRLVVDTEPKAQWAVARELRQRIVTRFAAAGIQLAALAPPSQRLRQTGGGTNDDPPAGAGPLLG